jgi:hypothetical protein
MGLGPSTDLTSTWILDSEGLMRYQIDKICAERPTEYEQYYNQAVRSAEKIVAELYASHSVINTPLTYVPSEIFLNQWNIHRLPTLRGKSRQHNSDKGGSNSLRQWPLLANHQVERP